MASFCVKVVTTMLEQQLNQAMQTAMKARRVEELEILRLTITAIRNKALVLGHDLTDPEVLAVIKAEAKKIKDALDSFVEHARHDLASKAQNELAILEGYLPAQMSDSELEQFVRSKCLELGVTNQVQAGKAMGILSKDLQGQADGGRIKSVLDKILTNT